jgi:hypothetical protein
VRGIDAREQTKRCADNLDAVMRERCWCTGSADRGFRRFHLVCFCSQMQGNGIAKSAASSFKANEPFELMARRTTSFWSVLKCFVPCMAQQPFLKILNALDPASL